MRFLSQRGTTPGGRRNWPKSCERSWLWPGRVLFPPPREDIGPGSLLLRLRRIHLKCEVPRVRCPEPAPNQVPAVSLGVYVGRDPSRRPSHPPIRSNHRTGAQLPSPLRGGPPPP